MEWADAGIIGGVIAISMGLIRVIERLLEKRQNGSETGQPDRTLEKLVDNQEGLTTAVSSIADSTSKLVDVTARISAKVDSIEVCTAVNGDRIQQLMGRDR